MKSAGTPVSYATSVKKSTPSAEALPDTALIIDRNIFRAVITAPDIAKDTGSGTPAEPGSQSAGAQSAAADNFDGKLVGVMTGEDESMAVLIYKDKEYIFRLDEEKDGIKLDDVGYYHAVFSVKGQRYRLVLKTEGADGPGSKQKGAIKVDDSTTETETAKISRRELVSQLSDVNAVIKSVLIIPYERNGQFEGYRVSRMTNSSVLKKIGVKRNDVIIRLNGQSLESPSVFFDALKNAENLSAVSLDILRSGKKMTIYVEIEG